MTQTSRCLSIDGPDRDGDFCLEVPVGDGTAYHYLNREEANALIVALGGTPPQSVGAVDPHADDSGKVK